MIAFVVSETVYKYLQDYLEHFKRYVTQFSIHVEIFTYDNDSQPIVPIEFKRIIFVQTVHCLLRSQRKGTDTRMFLFNTEQVTVSSRLLEKVFSNIKSFGLPIIDYSIENIKLLQKLFPNRNFIHLPFPIIFEKFVEKEYDLTTLESSKHRKTVSASIERKIEDFSGKWSNERDDIIRKSKILLNIHHSKLYCVFESIRCYHALEMGTLVISEPSVYMNDVLFNDFIIFVGKGKNMKTVVEEVLDDYNVYYQQCFHPDRIKLVEKRLYELYQTELQKII